VRKRAFFDLDGTLLPWDTQLMFCNHVLRRHGWRRLLLAPFLCLLPLAALRLLRSRALKRVFLGYLAGMTRARLDELAAEFADGVAGRYVWAAMKEEIAACRADGCELILNTASPVIYAEAIAARLGFDHCVATRVELPPRMPLVARIIGPNNKRDAKIAAMRARGLLDPGEALPAAGCRAYTDSPVDIPLLECAESGTLVHPAPRFAALAAARGWRILRPAPAPGRGAHWRGHLLMFCGLWRG
jgi:phosphoserine phosphatase